jgi:hypothetical protein
MRLTDVERDEILLRILNQIISIREGLADCNLYFNFHFKYKLDNEKKYLNKIMKKHRK